jgi:hypothetical protein
VCSIAYRRGEGVEVTISLLQEGLRSLVVLDVGREGLHNPNLLLHLMSLICLEVDGAVVVTSVGSSCVPNGFCVPVENLRMWREDPGFTLARDETLHASARFKHEFHKSTQDFRYAYRALNPLQRGMCIRALYARDYQTCLMLRGVKLRSDLQSYRMLFSGCYIGVKMAAQLCSTEHLRS